MNLEKTLNFYTYRSSFMFKTHAKLGKGMSNPLIPSYITENMDEILLENMLYL